MTKKFTEKLKSSFSLMTAMLLIAGFINIVPLTVTASVKTRAAALIAPNYPALPTTTTNYSNNTPVAIPTGPAVVSSTITVSGAGSYLWDLDVQTFIRHTFAADLDITITSPAGTVVTLTTDNGAGNDDVFNGTLWDDQADPDGQVPYTNNNGMVTDHAYQNGVLASPLTPEEPLAAFNGENPNGVWTLTISDDLAGDGGSLDSWSLNVTTFANAPSVTTSTVTSQDTPVTIPTGPAVVSSTINVSGLPNIITKVTLQTFIRHTFAADLDITITSPAGTVVTLTTDNGAGNDDVFNGTLWDDQADPDGQVPYTNNNGMVTDHAYQNGVLASPLTPEEPLAAFNGENPNGVWTLTISDDLAGDGGSLDSWSLNVTTNIPYPFSFYQNSSLLSPSQMPYFTEAKAGSDVSITYSLGGYRGANPYSQPPTSQQISCVDKTPIGPSTPIQTYPGDPFYNARFDTYTTVWRTQSNYAGTCRRLTLYIKDGSIRTKDYRFN